MKLDFSLAFAWLTGLCVFAALLTWIGGPGLALFIVCALLVNLLISVAVGKFAHWQDKDDPQARMDDDGAPTDLGEWPFGKKED